MRLTTRDLAVAAIASAATFGVTFVARAEPAIMGSRAVAWDTMKAEPTKTGEVRHVFRAPTPTLDELELHITTLAPGASPHAPHKHSNEEVVCIKEGTVESLVNGQTTRVGPGGVIFQASNQMHGLTNVGTTPATYFVISWRSAATPH
jgi:quercetin dioxygenase-like cupin family protein